ncbi:hypothetical protein HED60_11645 [Planctomycetales bacterium ZRK34]|nr:hypothetical protein HED60_11645 [Planctomycetales bacterium ZRK34]
MTQRNLQIFILAWAVAWFVAIVPAHQRGAVVVPGAEPAAASCDSCCESGGKSRPDDPVQRCAVCHIVAKLDVPPAVELFTPRLGVVEYLRIVLCCDVEAPESMLTIQGRAPPAFV